MQKIIKRTIFKNLTHHLSKPEISLILGARQTGKTTLLKELEKILINKKKISQNKILYFNLDILSDFEKFKSQTDFINFIQEQIKSKKRLYILIDEVQKIKNPGVFFKGIYDLKLPIKMILTGSASLEIKAKIIESMAGRKRIFRVFPFSFEEFIKTKKDSKFLINSLNKKARSEITNNQLKKYLFEYLIYGGYPNATLAKNKSEKQLILDEIFSSFVEKDIIGLLSVDMQESFDFIKLVKLLSSQIGNLINIEEISNTLKLSRKTVKKFIHYLEDTFIIKKLRPFHSNIRKEITKMPKIYFLDLGIRNFCQKTFNDFEERNDKGQILENYVFAELNKYLRYSKLYYWRTQDKSEVDFIIESGNSVIPIEVKAKELRSPKISKSLRSFIKKYNPKKAFVVNLELQDKIKINSAEVKFILPLDVLKICKN